MVVLVVFLPVYELSVDVGSVCSASYIVQRNLKLVVLAVTGSQTKHRCISKSVIAFTWGTIVIQIYTNTCMNYTYRLNR